MGNKLTSMIIKQNIDFIQSSGGTVLDNLGHIGTVYPIKYAHGSVGLKIHSLWCHMIRLFISFMDISLVLGQFQIFHGYFISIGVIS